MFFNWKKSSHSSGGDNCVEVSRSPEGLHGVRNSKFPHVATAIFTQPEWDAFIAGVKDGEFDD